MLFFQKSLAYWRKNDKKKLEFYPVYTEKMNQKEKTLGQKVDEMTNKISEVSSELGEKFESSAKETKKVANSISNRRDHASLETRITTIVGALLLIIALWNLKGIIWQILLLTAGILLITGVFDSFVQEWLEIAREKLNSAEANRAHKKTSKKENKESKEN